VEYHAGDHQIHLPPAENRRQRQEGAVRGRPDRREPHVSAFFEQLVAFSKPARWDIQHINLKLDAAFVELPEKTAVLARLEQLDHGKSRTRTVVHDRDLRSPQPGPDLIETFLNADEGLPHQDRRRIGAPALWPAQIAVMIKQAV
jgi:hypothetical protein